MAVENDIVLIYFEDKPLIFARVESILPDAKKDWYHLKLLLLKVPLEVVTWILRDTYINGAPFTMGGKTMRLELVRCPPDPATPFTEEPGLRKTRDQPQQETSGKVISLTELKKKNFRHNHTDKP